MKLQEHQNSCRCYECYLASKEWIEAKKRARHKHLCLICGSKKIEWHHYKGYAFIWQKGDYKQIVPLCRSCHQRNHFSLYGRKTPLTKTSLWPRFYYLKWSYPIRSYRPSQFLLLLKNTIWSIITI